MTQLWYQQATFLLSAAAINQLQPDIGNEVAFVGRSNAGKSSALNVITAKKNLARTSKTPGRTQLINLFALGENQRLVDLPGYGYAKVAQKVQQNWQRLLETYLRVRQSLKGLVLIMDIRHPLKETDQQILQWAITCQLPVHILLTKADKLSRGAALQTLQQINSQLAPYSSLISTQTFSALTKQGVDEARQVLAEWLEVRKETNSMKNI